MRSIDANIVLRWITRDDPRQTPAADRVMESPVLVPLTVLVEVAWVLRRTYRYDRAALNGALRILAELNTVSMPQEAGVLWALDRHAVGADLPDMLHLVASRGASSFATFERKLAERAGPDTPLPIELLA